MNFENNNSAQIDLTMEVPYMTFPVLSQFPFLRHGFSTRLGGVSSDMFYSLNLGSDSSPYIDDPANIEENYRRISQSIGIDPHSLVISKQVHKTNIKLVNGTDCGKGLFIPRDFDEIDAFITNTPNVTLVTKYADCVPLFFVDPKKKAIGLAHSGWRGTIKKIGKLTLREMQKNFGCDSKDIIAVMGPSICKDCYEVGDEVVNAFRAAFKFSGNNNIIDQDKEGKYHCNLWEAIRITLLEVGLYPENIHISGVCTACNSELFFSHRKTEGKRGSMGAFLAIKDDA